MYKISTIISLLIFQLSAIAYPHFVGIGYTSCITCHYNPFGNGPLNDYGRALSATAVSARWMNSDFTSEEELANSSGFLASRPDNNWFRPSFDYRGLLLKRNLAEDSEETEFINMMADAAVVINYTDRLHSSFSIGYAPEPKSMKNSSEKLENYRWREAYFGYRLNPGFGVYIGLMDKIFGIRIAEHTNYSRSITNLNQNDQSHGVQIHMSNPKYELGLGYFLGNLAEEEKTRQKGASLKFDYVAQHKRTIGVSFIKSQSTFMEMYAAAFHMKTSVGKGSAFLAEAGRVSKKSVSSSFEVSNNYAFIQAYLNAARGFYLINSVDYVKNDDGSYLYRLGPGLQVFPAQRFELRVELYNTRVISEKSSTRDSWDFLGQAHIWL